MKVYILECSYIEDTSIEAVYADEKKAEAKAEELNAKADRRFYNYYVSEAYEVVE